MLVYILGKIQTTINFYKSKLSTKNNYYDIEKATYVNFNDK
jgi:hypothetical protein